MGALALATTLVLIWAGLLIHVISGPAGGDAGQAAPALSVALVGLGLAVGLLVVLAGIMVFVARQVLAPLSRITAMLGDMSLDDGPDALPEMGRKDEIGALARAVWGLCRQNASELRHESGRRVRLEERVLSLLGAVEHIPVSIIITSRRGIIEYVNPKFVESSGFSTEEVIGQKPSLFKSGQTAVEIYREMWRTILAGKEWRGEFYNRRKSGELYWEKSSIAPIHGPDGQIRHFIAVKEDITERKDAELRVWRQAHFDPLTELPNRILFDDRLSQAIARSNRSGLFLALMFVDLDHFKAVNDTQGHEAGDELLRETGIRLKTCVRESDTVSRVGGDEFVILLSDLNRDEEAGEVAQRIIAAVSAPYQLTGGDAGIGVSIGIAVYPRDGHTAASLLKNADAAMYRSKAGGRNTFRFFSSDPVAYLD
jgi:diguanylate cyclase (GGDEF)-like protein/PAS domain S-box-containing protein